MSLTLQPLGDFAVATLLALIALRTTKQSFRWALLLSIAAFSISALNNIDNVPVRVSIKGLMGQFIVVWQLHMVSLLVIEQHILEQSSWTAAYKMVFNPRRIPTCGHVQSPAKSGGAVDKRLLSSIMKERSCGGISRSERLIFAINQIFRAALCYMAFYVYTVFGPATVTSVFKYYELSDGLRAVPLAQQAMLLRRLPVISVGEIVLRIVTVAEFVLTIWLIDNFAHALLSLTFVCLLHLDVPKEWPPLFGDIRTTYSVRMFWGKFWHRLVAPTYQSISYLILYNVFGVNPRQELGKVLTSAIVFSFSGATHALVTWRQGFRCGWWEDVAWFGLNFGAILIEDVGGKMLLRRTSGVKYIAAKAPWLSVLIGYLWTWGFFFWSLPKMQYPKLMCGPV